MFTNRLRASLNSQLMMIHSTQSSSALVSPASEPLSGQETDQAKNAEIAQAFEASFITQMLQHSGLAKALTQNGGQMSDAFSGFLLEAIAENMAEKGGFGLAEPIRDGLNRRANTSPTGARHD